MVDVGQVDGGHRHHRDHAGVSSGHHGNAHSRARGAAERGDAGGQRWLACAGHGRPAGEGVRAEPNKDEGGGQDQADGREDEGACAHGEPQGGGDVGARAGQAGANDRPDRQGPHHHGKVAGTPTLP